MKIPTKEKKNKIQVIQFVTFSSPNVGLVTNNLWKGHLTIPKKVTAWITRIPRSLSVWGHLHRKRPAHKLFSLQWGERECRGPPVRSRVSGGYGGMNGRRVLYTKIIAIYQVESRWRNSHVIHVLVCHGPLLSYLLGSSAIYFHNSVIVIHGIVIRDLLEGSWRFFIAFFNLWHVKRLSKYIWVWHSKHIRFFCMFRASHGCGLVAKEYDVCQHHETQKIIHTKDLRILEQRPETLVTCCI